MGKIILTPKQELIFNEVKNTPFLIAKSIALQEMDA